MFRFNDTVALDRWANERRDCLEFPGTLLELAKSALRLAPPPPAMASLPVQLALFIDYKLFALFTSIINAVLLIFTKRKTILDLNWN